MSVLPPKLHGERNPKKDEEKYLTFKPESGDLNHSDWTVQVSSPCIREKATKPEWNSVKRNRFWNGGGGAVRVDETSRTKPETGMFAQGLASGKAWLSPQADR